MLHSTFPQPYRVELSIFLEGYVRYFSEGVKALKDKPLLEISTTNTYRLMEQWRYNFSSLGRRDEKGIDKAEAEEVYSVLDETFREVFLSHHGDGREAMAVYMERVVHGVHSEMVEGHVELPGARQDLIRFLELAVQKLRAI